MKKTNLLLLICMLFVMTTTVTAQTFGGGSGTISAPYLIYNVDQLNSMRDIDWTAAVDNKPYFKLMEDIDLAGTEWQPINNASPYCHVYFDGNGHIIKNMSAKGSSYASLFGVLCGSCKNLGVVNADVEASNGSGIIAGYVGIKRPETAAYTGTIENCYTTGRITGSGVAGGIVGNVGKPSEGTQCFVKNCYSTADVSTYNETGNARAGGIVGIIYDKGVVINCYATGNVTSSIYAAGGIAGWADADITGCVARNKSIKNVSPGKIGRICSTMGQLSGVIAQGINCWAEEGMTLDNGGTPVGENDLITGEVTVKESPYDGLTQTKAFLENSTNYLQKLGWDFAGEKNVWAETMSNGYPIFQWLSDRDDHEEIDGVSSSIVQQFFEDLAIHTDGKSVTISNSHPMDEVVVYSVAGEMIAKRVTASTSATIPLNNKGVYIAAVKSQGKRASYKFILR